MIELRKELDKDIRLSKQTGLNFMPSEVIMKMSLSNYFMFREKGNKNKYMCKRDANVLWECLFTYLNNKIKIIDWRCLE